MYVLKAQELHRSPPEIYERRIWDKTYQVRLFRS